MKEILTTLAFAFVAVAGFAQTGTVTLELDKIASNNGQILVAFYDNADAWLEKPQTAYAARFDAKKGVMVVEIPNVKYGTYGIALLHDEDSNDDMTKNFIGIPKEDFGFSNISKMIFAEPEFADTAIEVRAEPIRIKML